MTSSHAIRTAVLALAVCASGASTAATITNAELSAVRWTGFDWDSNGSALITGFQPVPGSAFDLELYAWAGVIKNGITYTTALLDQNPDGIPDHAGGYEYTMYARLRESVIACVSGVCTFSIIGGSYEVWYDLAQNANRVTSTGFRDGIPLISGSFGTQTVGSLAFIGGSAFGGGPFDGGAGFGGDPYALYDDSQELMRVPSSMAAEWLGQPPLGGEVGPCTAFVDLVDSEARRQGGLGHGRWCTSIGAP